jgi:solute carrier family 10 (sodium/bile acid cotransporter), member 7
MALRVTSAVGFRSRFVWFDPFVAVLLLTLTAAALVPPQGPASAVLSTSANAAVGLQFFISGIRVAPAAAWQGLKSWRLQGLILAATFVFFPLLGVLASLGLSPFLPGNLLTGLVFLCTLPTAVQTATAFTGIARGNTAAAVCAASISNVLGILLTPLLVMLLLGATGSVSLDGVVRIGFQIFVPFLAGQLLHRYLGPWAGRHAFPLRMVDRGAILLVVYSAFGAAVAHGIWQQIPATQLALTAGACAGLLAVALWTTSFTARRAGFGLPEQSAITFCGSEKSLATGLPISAILFQAPVAGVVILPVIMYHALQLVVCAYVARRFARAAAWGEDEEGSSLHRRGESCRGASPAAGDHVPTVGQ